MEDLSLLERVLTIGVIFLTAILGMIFFSNPQEKINLQQQQIEALQQELASCKCRTLQAL